ncbi:alpha/beta fold hydrolase [Phytomonospora endophytica]|uniref:Pimeloyl-ACP methyl ester carboxylesterase n=1 Tax=Phytomonospora endophytica TaxID=714109 RepID=A0A841FNB2_9ACTN|nr:alpha/beta fold hydrolase [Phytomonospora endophytica]MBB6037334.1 pimeloyl-ACP methyl ester carboxylesterase [Phytomonospora endophytica]GIG69922.1 lysophospholipase [Phytomonospora endophytica]
MENALPMVFVHGIRISGTVWRPVTAIVGREHPVATPDLPGHGSRKDAPFTLDAAVDTVARAIDAVGGRALLVGHSMGGYVSIATAARHPGRVAGLVALGCTATPRGPLLAIYRMAARMASANQRRADRFSAWAFRRTLPQAVAEAMVAGGLDSTTMPQVVDALSGLDPRAELETYPGPVWLVNGARDPFRAEEKAFLKVCRDGRLLVLPRRTHISCLADSDVLARIAGDAAKYVVKAAGDAAD